MRPFLFQHLQVCSNWQDSGATMTAFYERQFVTLGVHAWEDISVLMLMRKVICTQALK